MERKRIQKMEAQSGVNVLHLRSKKQSEKKHSKRHKTKKSEETDWMETQKPGNMPPPGVDVHRVGFLYVMHFE